MGISDADFNAIMGAAHPTEDSSPPAISDQEFSALLGKAPEGSGSPVAQRSPQPSGNASLRQTWGKGALTGALGTITNNLTDYIESEAPGAFSETQYPQSFLNATPQERREYFQQQRAAVVDAFYKGVDTSNHPIANFGSTMVGGLADPMMAIAPELKGGSTLETLRNLSIFGGAFGAVAGASHGMATTGQIDPKEVAISAAVNAALTPFVGGAAMAAKAGLSALASHLFDHATATGRPVTPEEISDTLKELQNHTKETSVGETVKDFPLPPVDNVKMAQTLNEEGGLNTLTPEQAKAQAVIDNETGVKLERPDVIEHNYREGKADQFIKGEPATEFLGYAETRGTEERFHGTSRKIDSLSDDYAMSGDTRNIYGSGFYTTDAVDVAAGYMKKGKGKAPSLYKVGEAADTKIYDMEKPLTPDMMGMLKDTGILDNMPDDFLNSPKNLREIYDEFREDSSYNGLSRDEVQDVFDSIRYNLEQKGYRGLEHNGGLKAGAKNHSVKIYWNPEADLSLSRAKIADYELRRNIEPLINPWEKDVADFRLPSQSTAEARQILSRAPDLVKQVISSLPNKEMAMTRAGGAVHVAMESIADGDIPIESEIGKKIYPRSNEPLDPPGGGGGNGGGDEPPLGGAPDPMSSDESNFKPALNIGMSLLDDLAPMRNVWKKLGTIGDMMVKDFDKWKDNYRMQHGSEMVNFRKALIQNKIRAKDEPLIQQALSKLVDEKTLPENIQRATQQIRKQFNEMVAKYYKQGILTKEKAAEILANAKEKGYFPHIYDKAYLRTKAGQEAFIKALNDVEYGNEVTARTAIRSVMGEKRMANLDQYIEKQENGTYKLSPSIYEYLWQKSTNVGEAGVSAHMERARRFPPEVEPALQPFLIKDLDKVMSNYLHDTLIRLEGAKVWGNENESFGEMFRWAWGQNPEIAKSFRDAFFKEIGDPRSRMIRSFVEAPKWAATGSAILRNLQLLKLTFSSITNLTQLPTNGALWLANAKGVNPYQKLSSYLKGNIKGWLGEFGVSDFKEEAQAFGAATEHIYADFAGRISDASNLGKILDKIPIAGELIKNPGKYLDYVLFNASEDINRIGGYHMGKAYILQLLKNRAKLEGMGNRVNPNKLETVYKALEELGIARDTPMDKVSINQVEGGARLIQKYSEDMSKAIGLGAQRIDNVINFVNDAHELPRMAQSFWGKMLWQLRRFSYGQWQLVKDQAIKPALKGNLVPLATYLGVGTAGGMGINAFRKWILADDKQLTTTSKLLAAQATGASFGIVQDSLTSATYGTSGVAKFMMGPGLSEVANITAGVGNVYNQAANKGEFNLKPLGKAVLREMSFPYKSEIMKMSNEKSIFDAKFKNINEGKSPFD